MIIGVFSLEKIFSYSRFLRETLTPLQMYGIINMLVTN